MHQLPPVACVFDAESGEEIWFGDLDLTLEEAKLETLAQRLGKSIDPTPETPYRFEGLGEHFEDDRHVRRYEAQ